MKKAQMKSMLSGRVRLYWKASSFKCRNLFGHKKNRQEKCQYLSFSITLKVTTLHRTKDPYFGSKRKEEAEEQYCSVSTCLTVRVMCLYHQ
jgi:hypothetical protein